MNGKFLRFVDKAIGSILYGIYFIISKVRRPKCKEKNILAIKLWALGDSVMVLPALKAIKEKSKGKLYVLATEQNKCIFEGIDFIDEVIVLKINPIGLKKTVSEVRKKKIGICIDFEPYIKFSAVMGYLSGAEIRIGFNNRKKLYTHLVAVNEDIHAVKNFINLASMLHKIKYPNKLVELKFSKQDENNMRSVLGSYGLMGSKLVGIHAGSAGSSLTRRWPEERFAELADRLIEKYKVKIILVGSDSESGLNKKIIFHAKNKTSITDMSEKLKLKWLFALMERLNLFIANDSGPMHIAAAMGTPTIGLFGPNLPERYGPYGKKNIGIYKGSGIPAVRPFKGIFSENKEILKIHVSDVLDAVKRIRAL